jgi:hypothetical protein
MTAVAVIAMVVTVLLTMPHPPPAQQISIDQLEMIFPDAAQTELVAAMVKGRLTQRHASPGKSGAAPACVAASTPRKWNGTQRANATTIVEVGVALGIPERGEVIALATAMQESQLYNLGYLGANNDHDSLGLFQQRPSMGWGTAAQVTDPIYSATAFYLALQRVPGWISMALTDAAQSVQRSGFPYAYTQWGPDASALTQQILCSAL